MTKFATSLRLSDRLYVCLTVIAVGVFGMTQPAWTLAQDTDERPSELGAPHAAQAEVAPDVARGASDTMRPNIVVIVSDDQGFGDIQWNNPEVNTPHLARLAREGVQFDRFYANPICSVTRAALLTGFATLRTQVNNSSGLDLKYRTLPQEFQAAGYQTWMCGKWHLGGPEDSQRSGEAYYPQSRGFEHFYGHLHGAIDYDTHHRKDTGELDWQRNGRPIEEAGFSTDLLAAEAVKLIETRDQDRPFLLYLAFNAVHGPLSVPPGRDGLSKRDRTQLMQANIESLDAGVGRVLTCLEQSGLDQSTLVLFFSDNGGQLSQGANNGPLRGEKGETFEGGIRVPAAMRWPGTLEPGRISEHFLCVTDLLPTLRAAAGIEPREGELLDGSNQWSAIVSNDVMERPRFVMGSKDTATFDPPWKLVLPGRGVEPLLFHIIDDPNETTNLAAEHPELVEDLVTWTRSIGSPQPRRSTPRDRTRRR
ncbi:MAG: sulfatase-like hydrolase/transferase [Planctomycetales bacterium]|nr:sulfatase-like hydrolase/transferase [Planctomycetales bacterium]